MDIQLLTILGIIFFSAFLASTFGFGFGLIAMPLMALVLDLKTAVPLIAITSAFLASIIFYKSRHEVDFRDIRKLIAGSVVGIPIGLYFLKGTDESVMKMILALMLILFALYSLFGKVNITLKSDWLSYPVGLVAGIINAAYNMGGPPVIIYGALKQWSPSAFRVNIFSWYCPLSIIIVTSHLLAGLVTRSTITWSALSLPLVVIATIAGEKLNRSIPARQFNILIHISLLLIGFLLIYKVVWG